MKAGLVLADAELRVGRNGVSFEHERPTQPNGKIVAHYSLAFMILTTLREVRIRVSENSNINNEVLVEGASAALAS